MAATPPSPIASPSVIPEASPVRFGRYAWPSTIVIEKLAIVTKPMSPSSAVAPRRARSGRTTSSGSSRTWVPTRTVRAPQRSTSPPPTSVPTAPMASISVSAPLPAASLVLSSATK